MLGLTQTELAKRLGVARVTIQRIEENVERGKNWRFTQKRHLLKREQIKLWAAMNAPQQMTETTNYRIYQERKKWLNDRSLTRYLAGKSKRSSFRKSENAWKATAS